MTGGWSLDEAERGPYQFIPLAAMADWLGLERVSVNGRRDLARPLSEIVDGG